MIFPQVIIVTSCTNRKKNTGEVLTLDGANQGNSLAALVHAWVAGIASATQREVAVNLYKGRSFSEAKLAAQEIGADLYVISAGHGLIHSDDRLPSYNLTVSASPSNELHRSLLRLQKTPSDWWQLLTQQFAEHRSFAALMARTGTSPVLLAIPSPYLSLISQDLAALKNDEVARLRIFTSEFGASELPERLRSTVMPYDERLEALPNFGGTRVDFAQRALRHFVRVLQGHELPLERAKEQVLCAMNVLVKPALPKREKKSDAEIVELMEQNWERLNGSGAALLRFLRDDVLVACEQGRFAKLRRGVQMKLKLKTEAHG
jgi:hypothetical protein